MDYIFLDELYSEGLAEVDPTHSRGNSHQSSHTIKVVDNFMAITKEYKEHEHAISTSSINEELHQQRVRESV